MQNKFMTIPKFAEILGVSRIAVYKKVKAGKIDAIKMGKIYFIPERYVSKLQGGKLSRKAKKSIERAVKRTVKEYGETLRLLGKTESKTG
ncbi:MAG: helix-turn-helix domain-containing protein [candidate division Zixibacteria bacterium]|nr:helix-turn-helix domain-containing protein [candidate division Zixibacteria bacterium]